MEKVRRNFTDHACVRMAVHTMRARPSARCMYMPAIATPQDKMPNVGIETHALRTLAADLVMHGALRMAQMQLVVYTLLATLD